MLAEISSIGAANAFIRDVYLPVHNAGFAVAAAQPGSAHIPMAVQRRLRAATSRNSVRFQLLQP